MEETAQLQERLRRAEARNRALLYTALPASHVQIFEGLPDGTLRLFSAVEGTEDAIRTPKELLDDLRCSPQWVPVLQAALEQAALGQDSELEFQTLGEEEDWIQIHLEPISGNPDLSFIGTIHKVTEEVQIRHQNQALTNLLNRMTAGIAYGLEIFVEENTCQIVWGSMPYTPAMEETARKGTYNDFCEKYLWPYIHPKDRERVRKETTIEALLHSFVTGSTGKKQEYRFRDASGHYVWHSAEFYFYRDRKNGRIKCNSFVRPIPAERRRELEEKSRLEEQEHALFLRAKLLMESEHELDFVQVISDYYQGIYVVDLNENITRSIKVPSYFTVLLREEGELHSPTMTRYARQMLSPDYIRPFLEVIQYDALRRRLDTGSKVELTYEKSDGTWICMRIFPMPGYSEETPVTLWVFEDETATVRLRREEERARVTAQAAEAANQAKSQFLANMSHEIRTPLNAILGMTEVGLREEKTEEKDDCFRDIRVSGRSLLENINSILDLSKIEAGKMEIHPEEYEILSTLHDVITVLQMHAQEKKLEFVSEIDETIPAKLFGDDVSISHILMNLGSNAVKYTHEGQVTLSVSWEPGEQHGDLVIHMKDTGIGIRKEDMPYLFQSFGRLDRTANRHIEGTGLGLTICRQLTELMGGRIGVESSYGSGSDFWIRIPQTVVDAAPCGVYRDPTRKESDLHYNTFIAPETAVLVVDDQPLNLKVCQGLLRPYELEIYTARSGEDALKKMTQVWPDLVFMDHMMPDMDGIETTARIRAMGKKDPYFAVVPIIALTANAMKGARSLFLEHGMNDFLSKPIEIDRLDAILKAWLPEDKQKPPSPDRTAEGSVPEPVPPELLSLPGIDAGQGMAYCGTAEMYRKTLSIFRQQIPERITKIEASLSQGDLESYVIEVHSLKSAARWIGAARLGDLAEELELAGRAGDKKKMAQDTPALLARYQTMVETLAKL